MMLFSIVPVTAGIIGSLSFAVAMTGPSPTESRQVVEQVLAQVRGLLPETLELVSSVSHAEPGQSPESLLID